MITTFKQKLIVAFSGLCALILIQSAVAYVLIQRAQFFEKRSLTAQEILVAYTNIGADKQRLKVWYAELLLTGKASAQVRDALIDRINDNIQKVHLRLPLQVRDTIFGSQGATAQARYLDDTKVLNTIEQNFANFRSKVSQSEFAQADIDKQQVWGEMLSTFDVSGGQDVRVLIANAIDQQLSISAQANGQANTAIELSNTMRLMALLVTIVSAIGMTWYFVKHLTQPIADLMLGTQQIQAATSSSALPVVVPYRSSDEFGSLAVSFNSMAHEIHLRRISDQNQKQQLESAVSERTTQLVKANEVLKLDEIRRRQLFSDLGHELRTPATVILGEAEIALRGSDKSIQDYQLSLSNIATTTRQLTQRINGLLLIARGHFQADELDFASGAADAA